MDESKIYRASIDGNNITVAGGVQKDSNIKQAQPFGNAVELTGCEAYGVSGDMGELSHIYDAVGSPLSTRSTVAEEDDYETMEQYHYHFSKEQSNTLPSQHEPITVASSTSQSYEEEQYEEM